MHGIGFKESSSHFKVTYQVGVTAFLASRHDLRLIDPVAMTERLAAAWLGRRNPISRTGRSEQPIIACINAKTVKDAD